MFSWTSYTASKSITSDALPRQVLVCCLLPGYQTASTSLSHCLNFMPILQLLPPLIPIHCFSIVDCRNNSHEVPISTFDTSFDLGLIRGIFTPRDDVSYLMRWWCVHDLLLLLIVPFACKTMFIFAKAKSDQGKTFFLLNEETNLKEMNSKQSHLFQNTCSPCQFKFKTMPTIPQDPFFCVLGQLPFNRNLG